SMGSQLPPSVRAAPWFSLASPQAAWRVSRLLTCSYNPHNRHDGSALALTYSLRRRSCRVMGALVISPLPPLVEDIRCSKAPSLHGRYPLPRYSEPRRRRLVFRRFPGVAGYTTDLLHHFSRWDEDGFSSCSTCPCHRAAPNPPAGVTDRFGQPTAWHAAFAPDQRARPPESFFCRGHHWVHLRCGPVTRSPSRRWLGRSASSASFPPRMRPKLQRFLTFPPVGLSPTEHVCLSWTHWSANTPFGRFLRGS